jgi:hypothetical protein
MNSPAPSDNAEARANRAAFFRSMKLNLWILITTAVYVGAAYAVRRHPEWSAGWKVALTLSPVLPGLAYAWLGLRMLRAMDELQRRIQLEAALFAALATVLVHTVVNVLTAHGLGWDLYPHGLGLGGTYLSMFIFWCLGLMTANLRYR